MRLTEKTDSGNWCLRDVPWDDLQPGVVITKKTWEKLYGALWKLKDYEDSGKNPNEVKHLVELSESETERSQIPVTEQAVDQKSKNPGKYPGP